MMPEPIQVAEKEAGIEIARKLIIDSPAGEERFILLFNIRISVSSVLCW